ncbi:hypothetical protein RS130_11400 [Paraglaciecola aquimarina]|uniref:Uncharacterized protein n=1 Tax=Paraglaciecola aquimarina TaxID=1235557 RepID=A0ABU3SWS1_9ALTE|nr:hypothetical protein [Paraglaciecola aquimarina]MDU0354460.1 hypothetical protein [Paraglaciecola aquimarina]
MHGTPDKKLAKKVEHQQHSKANLMEKVAALLTKIGKALHTQDMSNYK